MIKSKSKENVVAINIAQSGTYQENAVIKAFKIKYSLKLSKGKFDLVALVELDPQQGLRVQKILVGVPLVQTHPRIIKELAGYHWTAVPVGEENKEIPNIAHLWTFPDIYIAACEPSTGKTSLARQMKQIQEKDLLIFYTLKEWWKKSKHLGFDEALFEYKKYLGEFYSSIKELTETGEKIVVRVADVSTMKQFMAENSLPEHDPQSWQKAGEQLKELNGTLCEEFPPLGPAGVIEGDLSAYISFHSYDTSSDYITYISVLIESGENVINQYLVWNTGVNDLFDDIEFIKKKLSNYGVSKKQFNYELLPMFGAK